jgi:hypothetical protein
MTLGRFWQSCFRAVKPQTRVHIPEQVTMRKSLRLQRGFGYHVLGPVRRSFGPLYQFWAQFIISWAQFKCTKHSTAPPGS